MLKYTQGKRDAVMTLLDGREFHQHQYETLEHFRERVMTHTGCTRNPNTCDHSRPEAQCPEHPECKLTGQECTFPVDINHGKEPRK